MPPELHDLDDDAEVIALPKHDIWSLGIIVHQMFAKNQNPFKIPDSSESVIKNAKNGVYLIDHNYIPKDSKIAAVITGNLLNNF